MESPVAAFLVGNLLVGTSVTHCTCMDKLFFTSTLNGSSPVEDFSRIFQAAKDSNVYSINMLGHPVSHCLCNYRLS